MERQRRPRQAVLRSCRSCRYSSRCLSDLETQLGQPREHAAGEDGPLVAGSSSRCSDAELRGVKEAAEVDHIHDRDIDRAAVAERDPVDQIAVGNCAP